MPNFPCHYHIDNNNILNLETINIADIIIEVVVIKLKGQSPHNSIESKKVILTSFKPPSQSKDEFDAILKDVQNTLNELDTLLNKLDTDFLGDIA